MRESQQLGLAWIFAVIFMGLSVPQAMLHSETRIDAMQAVQSLTMMSIAAGGDIIGSVKDCATVGSSGGPAWQTCAMIGLNVMALVGALQTVPENEETIAALDPFDPAGDLAAGEAGGVAPGSFGGFGAIGSGGFDPGTFDGGLGSFDAGLTRTDLGDGVGAFDFSLFCSERPEFCKNDCADISSTSTTCSDSLVVPEELRELAASDSDVGHKVSQLQNAMDEINLLKSKGRLGSGSTGSGKGSDQVAKANYNAEESVGSAYTGGLRSGKKKALVGLQGGHGQGKVSLFGLDAVDEKSGKKLTLWERATRRYYGAPERKRLHFLARLEQMRLNALEFYKKQQKRQQSRLQVQAKPAAAEREPTSKSKKPLMQ